MAKRPPPKKKTSTLHPQNPILQMTNFYLITTAELKRKTTINNHHLRFCLCHVVVAFVSHNVAIASHPSPLEVDGVCSCHHIWNKNTNFALFNF